MTDTGQIPGEGLPENAGMVEQPGVPAPDAYTYLSETTAEDEDLLLPGAQGAWGHEVPPPPPEPVVEAVHEPGPHEMSGRDSGSVDLGAVRPPAPAPAAPRRPLHLGPPIPDTSASPVRSLADRGPADAPVRQPAAQTTAPEHQDAPHAAAPWGAQVPVGSPAPAAETVVPAHAPAPGPGGAAQAVVARVTSEAATATAEQPAEADGAAQPQPAEAGSVVTAGQPAEETGTHATAADGAGEAATADAGGDGTGQAEGAEGAVGLPYDGAAAAPDAQAAEPAGATEAPEAVEDAAAVGAGAGADAPDAAATGPAADAVDGQPADAGATVPGQPAEPEAAEAVQPAPSGAVEAVPPVEAGPVPQAGDGAYEAEVPQAGDGAPAGAGVPEGGVTGGQEADRAAHGATAADAGEPVAVMPVAEAAHQPAAAVGEGPQSVQAGEAGSVAEAVQGPEVAQGPEAAVHEPVAAPGAGTGALPETVTPSEATTPADAQAAEMPVPVPVPAQAGPADGEAPEAGRPHQEAGAPDAAVPAPEGAPAHGAVEAAEGVAPAADAVQAPEDAPAAEALEGGAPVSEAVQAPDAASAPEYVQVSEATHAPEPAQAPEAVQMAEPAQAPGATEDQPTAENPAPAQAPLDAVPQDAPASDVPGPGPEAVQPVPYAVAPSEPAAVAGYEDAGQETARPSGTDPVPAEGAPQAQPVPPAQGPQSIPAAQPGHVLQPAVDGQAPLAAAPAATPAAVAASPAPADPATAHAEAVHAEAVHAEAAHAEAAHAETAHVPATAPAGPPSHPDRPFGEFVPVEGQAPAAPHLAPAPEEQRAAHPAVTVPAPREADPEPVQSVQNADDLDTRAADQEDQEDSAVSTAAGAEARQSTGPAAPAYDDAEREAVLKVMRERRDIRNGFRSDPIPHEVLLRVLEAAHTAPSVGHSQPWDFVVIRSADTRRAMHELAMRQREAYARSLPKGRAKQFKELKIEAILDTPVNIVVTADPTRGGRHTLGRHTQPKMAPYSAALAVENLWLAARAEGLGVGWVSFFDEREMVRALGLPEHLEVIAYLCVGYVDEFPDEPELMQAGWSKRRPLSWVVHEETYGRRALPGEEPHDLLAETVAQIRPLDAKALGEAWERQKRMTKPAGALGMLEIISAQLCGLSRQCPPPIPEPAAVAVFAGDHGVHAQGVTPWPQEVTGQMVANFLGGGAVCNAFATQVGAEVCVVDVGVAADLPATPGLLPRKVRAGTADMTTGPAMTREEAKQAIEVGIETARDLVAAGNKALLTGEMGIANTTASAALISVFTGADPAEVTGRGTGINDETLARKTEVVRRAIELHRPDPADPIGVLAAIGGLEHAAMVGLLLGGASLRTPVILDGVSAGAAALVARAIAPEVLAACIAGHRSAEPGHVAALNKLGLRPLVDLDLRLGEGTGALLALPMVQSTARAMHEVATFDSAGVTEK
ncbi:nicotinate-nucleotide--dimethylbenzimidazole phosphoribosyltransferase [Streptomyces sp. NPDC006134]|uniref:nicotinate-nucleotide--dimethylbenzimidazole phosphoribosyltransferase n=1 Tax=Streptomyces sp. NPDC006134 TaxID=3154467 RepID=UPI00340398AD